VKNRNNIQDFDGVQLLKIDEDEFTQMAADDIRGEEHH